MIINLPARQQRWILALSTANIDYHGLTNAPRSISEKANICRALEKLFGQCLQTQKSQPKHMLRPFSKAADDRLMESSDISAKLFYVLKVYDS